MSVEREFPLPKVLGLNAYAPRQHREEETGDDGPPRLDLVAIDPSPPRKIINIKGWLKLLTHREMREFVREIFDAHEQLFPQNEGSVIAKSIKVAELSDVLDKVAHGD